MEKDMSELFRHQLNELRNSLVPDIVALELYNHKKSRLRCSIAWLLSKVFDGHVPLEYEDPFIDEQYTDEETSKQIELNPSVAALLTSGRAYSDAARIILRQQPNINAATSLHAGVLVLLQQCGFYTLSEEPSGKNSLTRIESQLSSNDPFKASVHQSVIDAFLRAYLVNNFSADRVTSAIRSIAHLSPVEQPRSTEEALLLWIAKVCHVVRVRLEADRRERAAQLTRQNGRSTVRLDDTAAPVIPVVKDLLADISDGAALATLICHYCPDHLRISDVALKDPLGVADSCFNLEIVRLFSDHLDRAVYFFRLEDLLYMHSSFKPNVIVFLADFFACLCSAPPLLCACSRPLSGSVSNSNNNENHQLVSNSLMKSGATTRQSTTDGNNQQSRSFSESEITFNNNSNGTSNGGGGGPLFHNNNHHHTNGNGSSLLNEVEFSSDFGDIAGASGQTDWPPGPNNKTVIVVADDSEPLLEIPSGRKQLFVKRSNFHCHRHHRRRHYYRNEPNYHSLSLRSSRSGRQSPHCSCFCNLCTFNEEEDGLQIDPRDFYYGHAWRRNNYEEPPQRRMALSRSLRLALTPQRGVAYPAGLLTIVPTPSPLDNDDTSSILSSQGGIVMMAPTQSSPPVLSLRQSSRGSSAASGTTLTQPNSSRPMTATSYTVVSSSRQFATAESALEAGLPVVSASNNNGGGAMSVSPTRSLADSNAESIGNRITWAQLQQQQQARQRQQQRQSQERRRQTPEDDEVEQIVQSSKGQNNHHQQVSSIGLGGRSASVGSLSLKLQLERRRREAEQQKQESLLNGGSQYGAPIGTRRPSVPPSISNTSSGTNGTWNVRSPRLSNGGGSSAEGYNQRLEQLNQSLSDLHMQLSNLSSPRRPSYPQQQVVMVPQATPVHPGPVVIYQTTPLPGGTLPVQVALPGATTATYYQQVIPASQFQSTPSLLMPRSAFQQQQQGLVEPASTGGAFFVPIPQQMNNSNGAASADSASVASSNYAKQQLQMTDFPEDILESVTTQVRRSQSLSALANRLAGGREGSSTSLALMLGGPNNNNDTATEPASTPGTAGGGDPQNVAFVVGDVVDADELERRRRQKCVEMELKRKLESSGKKDVGKRDVDAARLREEIRQRQEEQERRRHEHRQKQRQVFEEWQQKKKQDEEQVEMTRVQEIVRAKTASATMTKSKSRDAISLANNHHTGSLKPGLNSARHRRLPVQSEHENLAALANSGAGAAAGSSKAPAPKPPGSLSSRNTSTADFGDAGSETSCGPSAADVLSITVTPSVPLRVQPSAKSNKTLVYNAIRDTCLAGGANAKQRQEALQELDKAPSHIRHLIILFRDAGCQYRGLYTFEPDASVIERIHGIGPKTIRNAMIEHFFKYNSGSKRFSSIPTTQHLSVSVDAVSVYQQFWQQRVASASATPSTTNISSMSRSTGPPVVSVPNSVLAAASQTTPTKRTHHQNNTSTVGGGGG